MFSASLRNEMEWAIASAMGHPRAGQVAVIFISESSGSDEAGYTAADGGEITISYWADDASAAAWRAHRDHGRIQHEGRGRWLKRYDLIVADIRRGHVWQRTPDALPGEEA